MSTSKQHTLSGYTSWCVKNDQYIMYVINQTIIFVIYFEYIMYFIKQKYDILIFLTHWLYLITERTHSVYREHILSVGTHCKSREYALHLMTERTHSVYREHILSIKTHCMCNTLHLMPESPAQPRCISMT